MGSPYDLAPFQQVGVKFFGDGGRAKLLADEQGLGKTIQALTALTNVSPGPVLIICRALNKPFWAQTIREIDPDAEIEITQAAGVFDYKRVASWWVPRRRGYMIIHHEALRYVTHELARMGIWQVVVADEAHRFRNRKAQQTKALKGVPSFYRWALTGTPIDESPVELWSVLNWLNPAIFSSYWKFHDEFVLVNRYTGQVEGLKNMDKFAELVAPFYLRRTWAEVRPEMPRPIPRTVPLEMTTKQAAAYRQLEHETLVQLHPETASTSDPLFIGNCLARLSHLRKMTLDPILFDLDDDGIKYPWLVEWAENNTQQFVVFTYSRLYANELHKMLPRGGTINGSISQKQRDLTIRSFQQGDLQWLVGTIDTMSESVNLQVARHAIFMELDWSAIDLDQAEGRVHRMSSTETAAIWRLVCTSTVDEDILRKLEGKWDNQMLVEYWLRRSRGV